MWAFYIKHSPSSPNVLHQTTKYPQDAKDIREELMKKHREGDIAHWMVYKLF